MDDAALADVVERLTVPLRMGDGLDETALAELSTLLTGLADSWRGRADVPKRAAALLTELYPALVGTAGLYSDDEAHRTEGAAEHLLDLTLTCLGSDAD